MTEISSEYVQRRGCDAIVEQAVKLTWRCLNCVHGPHGYNRSSSTPRFLPYLYALGRLPHSIVCIVCKEESMSIISHYRATGRLKIEYYLLFDVVIFVMHRSPEMAACINAVN